MSRMPWCHSSWEKGVSLNRNDSRIYLLLILELTILSSKGDGFHCSVVHYPLLRVAFLTCVKDSSVR